MEKRIRASKIDNVPMIPESVRPAPPNVPSVPSHRLPNPPNQFMDSSRQTPRTSGPVSGRERSIAFGLGLLVCVVGVILTPIIIGIPIIIFGLWMVLFPASFVRHSRKKNG